MSDWSADHARKTWSIPHWSGGYFDVADGAMQVLPRGEGGPALPLPALVEAATTARASAWRPAASRS